jgi:hypothetical protein
MGNLHYLKLKYNVFFSRKKKECGGSFHMPALCTNLVRIREASINYLISGLMVKVWN